MPWARLKPLNIDRGHVKERYVVGGKCFQGGDGAPGRIPVWYRVSKRQAAYLATKKQKNGNPFSADAFDIVQTAAEKDQINESENYLRMTQAGLAAPAPPAMAQPREETLMADRRGRVTMEELADDDDDEGTPTMDSRSAALAGLETPADVVDDEVDGLVDAARGTHEEMTGDRDVMSSASEQAELNADARAERPSFANLETDGEERPARRPRAAAIAAQKAEDTALAEAARKRDEKAAEAKKSKTTGLPKAAPPKRRKK